MSDTQHEMIDLMEEISSSILGDVPELDANIEFKYDGSPSTITVNDELKVYLTVAYKSGELPGYAIDAHINATDTAYLSEFSDKGSMNAEDDTSLFVDWFAQEYEQFFMDEIFFAILKYYNIE